MAGKAKAWFEFRFNLNDSNGLGGIKVSSVEQGAKVAARWLENHPEYSKDFKTRTSRTRSHR